MGVLFKDLNKSGLCGARKWTRLHPIIIIITPNYAAFHSSLSPSCSEEGEDSCTDIYYNYNRISSQRTTNSYKDRQKECLMGVGS